MATKTWLQKIGSDLITFFKDANKVVKVGDAIAQQAEPEVTLLFPGIGILFDAVVTAVAVAEGLGAAANPSNAGNSGSLKQTMVRSMVKPQVNAMLTQQNMPNATDAQVDTFIDSVVAAMNAFECQWPEPTTGEKVNASPNA